MDILHGSARADHPTAAGYWYATAPLRFPGVLRIGTSPRTFSLSHGSPRLPAGMQKDRRLVISYRSIAPDHREAYDAAWMAVRDRAGQLEVNAWRFEHPESPGLFVEFLEFEQRKDPRGADGLSEALEALDAGFDDDPGDVRSRSAWVAT